MNYAVLVYFVETREQLFHVVFDVIKGSFILNFGNGVEFEVFEDQVDGRLVDEDVQQIGKVLFVPKDLQEEYFGADLVQSDGLVDELDGDFGVGLQMASLCYCVTFNTVPKPPLPSSLLKA